MSLATAHDKAVKAGTIVHPLDGGGLENDLAFWVERDSPSVSQFAFLLDAPAGDSQVTTIPIARLGRFKDKRYGNFGIDRAQYESWVKNLSEHFHGRLPIDRDHGADRGGSSKAAGWITSLTLNSDEHGERVDATIEWTPEGRDDVKNKYWLYVSPTFVDQLKDEQGNKHGPALIGTALTNRPFLRRGMPAIALSQTAATLAPDYDFARRLAADPVLSAGQDSPSQMADLSNIAKTLGLDEDADEATILAAITEDPTETKTLDQLAQESGKVVLSADQVTDLIQGAADGKAARAERETEKYEGAFTRALDRGAVDAKDETRAMYDGIRELSVDQAVTLLDSLPAGAHFKADGPRGSGGTDVRHLANVPGADVVKGLSGDDSDGRRRAELDEDRGELALKTLAALDGQELTLEAFEAELTKQEANS